MCGLSLKGMVDVQASRFRSRHPRLGEDGEEDRDYGDHHQQCDERETSLPFEDRAQVAPWCRVCPTSVARALSEPVAPSALCADLGSRSYTQKVCKKGKAVTSVG